MIAIKNSHVGIITVLHLNYKQKITGKTADGGKKRCWNNGAIKIFK